MIHNNAALAAEPIELPAGGQPLPDVLAGKLGEAIQSDGLHLKIDPQKAFLIDSQTDATAIKVGRAAGSLYFLHTLDPGKSIQSYQKSAVEAKDRGDKPSDLPTVLTYEVHYSDGEVLDVPVRWDESIHDLMRDSFWDFKYGMFSDLDWATIAWSGATGKMPGQVATLYLMRWPNPRPQVTIKNIQPKMQDANAGTAYLFAAGTAEKLESGSVYHVSQDGDDDAAGSFDKPWRDPIAAMQQLEAGDTLYIRGGRYQPSKRLVKAFKGTSDKPITISGYPGETVILDAVNYTFSKDPTLNLEGRAPFSQRLGFIHVNGSSHLTVRNLHLEHLIGVGFAAIGSDHVSILHNTVYLAPASAIYLTGQDSRANHNTSIRACSLKAFWHHMEHDPARADDPNLSAQAEYLNNRRIRGGFGDECIDVGGTGSVGLEGAYNEICWGEKEAIDVKGGPEKVRIHHNYAHHNQFWVSIYVDGWTKPLRDVELSHNVSCNNFGIGLAVNVEHGPLVENIRIHHNLSFNNGLAGFESGGAGDDNFRKQIDVEFNTFHNNGNQGWKHGQTGAIRISSKNVEDITIRRNVISESRDYNIGLFGPDYASKNVVVSENLIHPDKPRGWLGENKKVFNVSGEDPTITKVYFVDPEAGNFRLTDEALAGRYGAYQKEQSP